jgi:hypothetical protein
MQAQPILADAIAATKQLLARYLAGFTDESHTRQAPGLPNHVAWCLGHCALTMHRVSNVLDGGAIPESDFTTGSRTAARFDTESVAFGSKPAADPSLYPSLQRCTDIYNNACDRLAAAVRAASDDKLATPVKWGQIETTALALASRMIFHNGMHTGQIADLRRALGLKSIFA